MDKPARKVVVIITPKDIQRITGSAYAAAARLHRKIRAHTGKAPHQFLTIEDFSTFTSIKIETIKQILEA